MTAYLAFTTGLALVVLAFTAITCRPQVTRGRHRR